MRIDEIEARKAEISEMINDKEAQYDVDALLEEVRALNKEAEEIRNQNSKMDELRKGVSADTAATLRQVVRTEQSADEKRALDFVRTGKMEIRQLLSTGTIAKPTKVGGISGLGAVASGIVDDVNAIPLTGSGAWIAAYKATDAAAAAVTDGNAVAGTASTYNYVTINPAEWGILDEISKQVKKMSPLDYEGAIKDSALIALRAFAASKIVAAVQASALAETRTSIALDATYLRKLRLKFRAIEGKGNVKLYLTQNDLSTLGDVRGTNEKKAVFEITFDDGSVTSGIIKDGGLAIPFRVDDNLTDGIQLFGQPGAIDMPMWDNYAVETDEGGDYFKRNMIGIRGLQTANADLVAYHGMQIIKQAAS